MNLPKIIDNNRRSLYETLSQASNGQDCLSVATGYWDLESMRQLMPLLRELKSIRLLIGREPLIPRYQLLRPELDYPDQDFKFDLSNLAPDSDLKDIVTEIKEWIEAEKLEVKVYRKNFLHAKCYIFGSYDSDEAVGIIGSSNLTKNGLNHNSELNALESDHRVVLFKPETESQEIGHLSWFDAFWNDENSEIWNEEFGSILESSPVGDTLFSPYETYIKTLFELYKDEIIEDELSLDEEDKGRTMFAFQHKNVQSLLRKLRKYRVAMLSDSVGLGKTVTAINVIKQYLEGDEGKRRVEIICPKSLVQQWEKELTLEGIYGRKPITLQNPNEIEAKQELDDIASVSLFVIDESHNLRQTNGKRFQMILDWIRSNPKAHVLLLTATPINNQLGDLTSQILLGTGGDAEGLKLTVSDKNNQTEQRNFYQIVENLNKKIKQDLKRDGVVDYQYMRQVMMPIIRTFVVRRTRQGIEKEYGSLIINGVEKRFPKVIPEVLEYDLDQNIVTEILELNSNEFNVLDIYKCDPQKLADDLKDLKHPLDQLSELAKVKSDVELDNENPMYFVFQLILSLGFIPYRWQLYKSEYYGKTRKEIKELKISSNKSKKLLQQLGIFGILRTVFLKRMESSVSALAVSLETYSKKLDLFEQGIDEGKIVSLDDLSALEASLGDEDLEVDEDLLNEHSLEDIDDKSFALKVLKQDIQKEKELIRILQKQLEILNRDDSKIVRFAKELEVLNQKYPDRKILVFSYFADTIKYLEENIFDKADFLNNENSGFVSSKSSGDSENLASRFSPKSKNYTLKDDESELQFLFSTDVLSEGQNLQDAGILINYDLHWNPVRMIQRNGRVNRLGSDFEEVYIYNMRPEQKLDSYLRLIQRLQGKIDIIRNTIGTDTPVLDEAESPIEYTDSVNDIYSKDFQTRMKALEEAEKASDFLLSEDEFVIDLKKFNSNESYSQEYRELIYNISSGKWSLMPDGEVRGSERPEVLSLTKLYVEGSPEAIGYQFAKTNKDGSQIQAVSQLQALEWLRCDAESSDRVRDKISLDKTKIKSQIDQSVIQYYGEEEVGSLVGQENNILRLMYENGYEQAEIDIVRDVFKTNNIFDKREMSKLKTAVMRQHKKGELYQNDLRDLVKLANKIASLQQDEEQLAPNKAESVLFYVNKNE